MSDSSSRQPAEDGGAGEGRSDGGAPQGGARGDGVSGTGNLREVLAAAMFGRWPTWVLVILVIGSAVALISGILRVGGRDLAGFPVVVGGLVLAGLAGTVLSGRRRRRSVGRRADPSPPESGGPALASHSPLVRWVADPPGRGDGKSGAGASDRSGEDPDVPFWAQPFAARLSRTFPVPETALIEAIRAALSESPHFVLSEVHDGGATVHRRTQLAVLGERILLEFGATDAGTEVVATFRPLSPASVGAASGSQEIELLFRVIGDRVIGDGTAADGTAADGQP